MNERHAFFPNYFGQTYERYFVITILLLLLLLLYYTTILFSVLIHLTTNHQVAIQL